MTLRLRSSSYFMCLIHIWHSHEHHEDVIKWKYFRVTHKGQWCGAVMFSLICTWTNGWVNNRGAGYLRRPWAHYDVVKVVMNMNPVSYGQLVPNFSFPAQLDLAMIWYGLPGSTNGILRYEPGMALWVSGQRIDQGRLFAPSIHSNVCGIAVLAAYDHNGASCWPGAPFTNMDQL